MLGETVRLFLFRLFQDHQGVAALFEFAIPAASSATPRALTSVRLATSAETSTDCTEVVKRVPYVTSRAVLARLPSIYSIRPRSDENGGTDGRDDRAEAPLPNSEIPTDRR